MLTAVRLTLTEGIQKMANGEGCGEIAIRLRGRRQPLIGYQIVFEPTVTGPELMRRGDGVGGWRFPCRTVPR